MAEFTSYRTDTPRHVSGDTGPVGVAHKNRRVRLLVAAPDLRILSDEGELIRAVTLDPTRSYQPLGGRWPIHDVLQQACTMS